MKTLVIALAAAIYATAALSQVRLTSQPSVYVSQPGAEARSQPGSAVADLDGDGNLDLVTGSSGNVVVFRGLGNGRLAFVSAQPIAVGFGSNRGALAVADFNGDGKLDVVAVDGSSAVHVLLGNGDGTLQPDHGFAAGISVADVAVGDLNGDRVPDLALIGFLTGMPTTVAFQTLTGDGTGSFLALPANIFGSNCDIVFSPKIRLADFDRDGRIDAALACQTLSVAFGLGTGAVGPPQTVAQTLGVSALTVSDLNGDGAPDIIYGDPGHSALQIEINSGNGSFTQSSYPLPAVTATNIAVFQADSDGIPDIAISNFTRSSSFVSSIYVALGLGGGNFAAARPLWTSTNPNAVIAEDFNRDGHADLVIVTSVNADIALGDGTGRFVEPTASRAVQNTPAVVEAAADFNEDGLDDVLFFYYYPGIVGVSTSTGTGAFSSPLLLPLPGSVSADLATVGDLNGDRHTDIAVIYSNPTPGIYSYAGDGKGNFSGPTFLASLPYQPSALVAGDVNADGFADIVEVDSSYADGTSTVRVLFGNGDGTFEAPVIVHGPSNGVGYSALIADLNGDGVNDIAVLIEGRVITLLGSRSGKFTLGPAQPAAGNQFVSADFNRDGIPDLAVLYTYPNEQGHEGVQILSGKGDGSFTLTASYNDHNGPIASAAVDLNGDGFPDLVLANNAENVTLLINNGDGTFQDQGNWALAVLGFAAGHFTSDGRLGFVGGGSSSIQLTTVVP